MKEKQSLYQWERALIAALCVSLLITARLPGSGLAGWWCVMFPPLVPPAATETMARDDDGECEYQIRFRIAELWEMAMEELGVRS